MKVIDLLNKIAKGEKTPKKIKYDNKIFEYTARDYHVYAGEWLFKDYCIEAILNHEIEIIEEDKDIEEIPYHYNFGHIDCGDLKREVVEELSENFNYFKDKINELVRELNKIKKEGK